jgi:selenide,water dikinase
VQVLRHLPAVNDPRVLVASLTRDDAAVYRISDDRAIVATLDFFTPIVDDAYTFGAITAANALSDLYAMGADPLFALNIVAWPRNPEIMELIGPATQGVVDKVREAGIFVLGGHSIEDLEPKLGMVAIGEAHPDRLLSNAGARIGDLLILTKPIGTGILATALKQSSISEGDMLEAIRSMTTLNAGALAAIREVSPAVHAATDVTGFGLLGHLHTMLTASGAAATIDASRVPMFDGVPELVANGAIPGGTKRNEEAAGEYTAWSRQLDGPTRTVLCDAQTSGGLLVAVEPGSAEDLIAALLAQPTPAAAVIGEIVAGETGSVEVRHATA